MDNYINDLFESNVNCTRTIEPGFIGDDHYNISNRDLLNLCGGIPLYITSKLKMEVTVVNSGLYEVEITNDYYLTSRVISFPAKIITNSSMFVNWKGSGTGLNLLYNQIKSARQMGFKELRLTAVYGTDFTGYYQWGRFGYSMRSAHDIGKFEGWCKFHGLKPDTLYAVLRTKEGAEKWKTHGFTWDGAFSLTDNSENMELLSDHLKSIELGHFMELL